MATAVRLDDAERSHLRQLVRTTEPGRRAEPAPTSHDTVRPGIHRLLEGLTDLPAYVFNNRLDILAANPLGRVLYSPLFDDQAEPPNSARFTFLREAEARRFWPDWPGFADYAVAVLRTEVGRHPHDAALTGLVARLPGARHPRAAHRSCRLHRVMESISVVLKQNKHSPSIVSACE
ncbi:hypothetical protein [Actinoplanes sp. M2I2]|uniref:MmyB family transcriptional regulator n=1 Tax=Actinoplanes sp. M2I2 TaxID=1734444 RepID=UPI0020224976|nr:hypothetical protein [Actinoplanes sp. M2I2]